MKMVVFTNPVFFKSWNKIYSPDKDLSPRLAYKAKHLNDYLTDQNKKFDELRRAIINKYAVKDEKGEVQISEGNVTFKPESIDNVNKEFSELTQLDLLPPVPNKLKVEELENNGVKLAGPDIAVLEDLLDFGDDAKPALTLVPNP
jgi:hypothetical protein